MYQILSFLGLLRTHLYLMYIPTSDSMRGGLPLVTPSKILIMGTEGGIYIRYKWVRNSPMKDRIWYMRNRLANHPHNNPFILFTNFINHIMSYDSLVLMMAEKFRYVTLLSLDVIISRLSQRRGYLSIIRYL